MDEHSRISNAFIADVQTENEQEASAAKVLKLLKAVLPKLTLNQNHIDAPLKMLLERYSAKCTEVGTLSNTHGDTLLKVAMAEVAVATHQTTTNLDVHTMDLDNLTTLDDYDRLLALSTECVQREVEHNARERIIITKLSEITALENKIMTEYGSEMEEKFGPLIMSFIAEARAAIESLRHLCIKVHRIRISMNS
jgi:hypothetical protein